MSGREYLEAIRTNLEAGRSQSRMGQNVLGAFGYLRRRSTAIQQINAALEELGLETDPSVDANMPLRGSRIRFSLRSTDETKATKEGNGKTTGPPDVQDTPSEDSDSDDSNLPEPGFTVSELKSASTRVERVAPDATVNEAYTKMILGKYSQLVVASQEKPRQQDIKGIVSFQSIAKSFIHGDPKTVADCTAAAPDAPSDADLTSILSHLNSNDVVLVIAPDKRLQGIVTAWDLAEEFAGLVEPVKRIGEIEASLQSLLERRLGKKRVADFLNDQSLSSDDPIEALEELTMGELQRVLEFPDHWDELGLVFDRRVFIARLSDVREYRNRLMHFRDPLDEAEMTLLSNFCDLVREIQP